MEVLVVSHSRQATTGKVAGATADFTATMGDRVVRVVAGAMACLVSTKG